MYLLYTIFYDKLALRVTKGQAWYTVEPLGYWSSQALLGISFRHGYVC